VADEDPKPWRPLDVRQGGTSEEDWDVLFDGVPNHLRGGLMRWLALAFREDAAREGRVQRRLRLGWNIWGAADWQGYADRATDEDLLRLVDGVLHDFGRQCWALRQSDSISARDNAARLVYSARSLKDMLSEASSAWTVAVDADWGLVRLVAPEMQSIADGVTGSGTHAGEEIRLAWRACFRLTPNYDDAYRRAVLAVEAVAAPFFIPDDPRPTLGKAISHLQQTTAQYIVGGLDDPRRSSAETLHAMLDLLWRNHGRHVEPGGTRPQGVTQPEAEAVVYLATTIVQLFQRGLVTRLQSS
jgi:hypothetical protein